MNRFVVKARRHLRNATSVLLLLGVATTACSAPASSPPAASPAGASATIAPPATKPAPSAQPTASPSSQPAAVPSAQPAAAGSSAIMGGPYTARSFPAGTTINVLVSASHQQFKPLWEALPQFEAQTGIKVNLTQVPTSDLRAKMLQDFQLGTGTYDAVEIPDDTLFAAQQFFAPLNPLIEAEGVSVEDWKKQFVPWSTEAVTFDSQVKYYPFYSGGVAVAYREELFNDPKEQASFKQEFNYDLPRPPRTMQQFLDVAKHFTRPGLWGVVFPGAGETGQNIGEEFIFRAGFPYFDINNHSLWGPRYTQNQAPVAAGIKTVQDMLYDLKVAPPETTGMQSSESVAFYQAGKAAMDLDLIYLPWNEYKKPNVVQTIGQSGSFALPSTKEGAGGIPFYWKRGITQTSKHKDAAWEFTRWVTAEDNLKQSLQNGVGVFVPTNVRVLDWAVQNNIVPQGVADNIKTATFYPLNTAAGQARQVLRKYYEQLTLKQITPQQFAEQSGSDIEQLMVQSGAAH